MHSATASRRRYRRASATAAAETLERRLLLSGGVPTGLGGVRDLVFDDARGLLYATTAQGTVERYDPASGTVLAPVAVGQSAVGADISPDHLSLYVVGGVPAGS